MAQALVMSCHHQPRRKTLERNAAIKDQTTRRPWSHRRTYSSKEPHNLDKYFQSWDEREDEYLSMDVVIYLKTTLMELAADKIPSKAILSHPGYLSMKQYILDDVKNQSTKNIAFVLWLCGRYKLKDKELHRAMIKELDQRNPELLSDRQLGIVPWSLTVLGHHEDWWSLIETCVDEAIKRMKDGALCDHFTVSQLCWCFVTAQRWPEQFTTPLNNYITKYMRDFAPHTLSTITWALQKRGVGDLAQLTRHTQVARSNFSKSNMQSHSMMLWSLGKANHFDQPYFERVTEEILSGKFRNDMDALMLCVTLWSFAQVGYRHYDLLEQLSAAALDRIDEFSLRQLSRFTHSLCHLNYLPRELLDAAARKACAKFANKKDFGDIYPAMEMMYACLVCDYYPPELLSLIMDILQDGELKAANLQNYSTKENSTANSTPIYCNHIPCIYYISKQKYSLIFAPRD